MLTGKLTARRVTSESSVGRHGDGGGLYLVVNDGGSKQWMLRTTVHGRRKDIGLGGVSHVTLAQAREEARKLRSIARTGGDPLAERRRETISFEQAARRVFDANRPTWKNAKHAEQWIRTLETYSFPYFGDRSIETITSADILNALTPIWTSKPETAKRLRQRMNTVFDWAKGAGHYRNENPVTGIKKALPNNQVEPKHLKSLNWQDLPNFVSELEKREAVSALCLKFIILTASRSNEARGAKWCEIEGGMWTVPAERMKMNRPHRIPLSAGSLEVLNLARGLDSQLIFPSTQTSKPLSVMAFKPLMKRMGYNQITTHGFRSTFRDWCNDFAHAPREVAEAALSHRIGDSSEQAYSRSDLYERRAPLMESWGRYATNKDSKVISINTAAQK